MFSYTIKIKIELIHSDIGIGYLYLTNTLTVKDNELSSCGFWLFYSFFFHLTCSMWYYFCPQALVENMYYWRFCNMSACESIWKTTENVSKWKKISWNFSARKPNPKKNFHRFFIIFITFYFLSSSFMFTLTNFKMSQDPCGLYEFEKAFVFEDLSEILSFVQWEIFHVKHPTSELFKIIQKISYCLQ